ncbi:MAG TPA: SpoVR family protein [Candidatus Competibacter sp.]|nr:SpoVR family protein [Candidatus Competibacter sp.]
MNSTRLISDSSEWTFPMLERYNEVIGHIAANEFGLDTYPNQIEIITAEQMMDAYSSVGMPLGYKHWSYGKQFVLTEKNYRRGQMGLAYEIVINSDPCIAYLMEENTAMMQALVIAHAAYGHNSFFKGNYLFRTWTSADAIIDYLLFARNYVAECEEHYGEENVELFLDSCHALMNYGVDRYKHPAPLSLGEEKQRQQEREAYLQLQLNDLWRTIPVKPTEAAVIEQRFPAEPQENLLYFIEKNAPLLEPWQREIVRIVRKIGQYFYPQRQTQVMNEGWACVTGDTLIVTDRGLLRAQEVVESRFSGCVEDGNRVVNWFALPSKPRIRIRTRHGYELHGGADHKILVGGEWIELRNLKIGDAVEIRRGQSVFASAEAPIDYALNVRPRIADICQKHDISTSTYYKWRRAAPDLSVGAQTVARLQACADEWEAIKADPDQPWALLTPDDLARRPETLGPDLAEVLGQVIGDGFVDAGRINLTSQDVELLDFFEQAMYANFGATAVRRPSRNHFNSTVHSAVLARLFKQTFGIATGWGASGRKTVPDIILRSPEAVVCAFLRGHFDTDGCVSVKDRQVILVSKSLDLLQVEQLLILNLGIVSSVRPQQDGTFRLVITGSDAGRFAEKIGFRLSRKRRALKDALASVKWFLGKDDLTTIESIEHDEGPVFDFSVERSHAYKASCFINHNCFWHYTLMNRLYDEGYVNDGFMIEFLQSHTSVIQQLPFDHPYYHGINPYALGFAMMSDIKRMCQEPTDEDRYWFPDIAGQDWIKTLDFAMRNFKDESFIAQYLSPKVMRDFKLFAVLDDDTQEELEITAIHDDAGYRRLRLALSDQYNLGSREPNIQVWNVAHRKDRSLTLRHTRYNRRPLHDSFQEVLKHLHRLWGFTVRLEAVDEDGKVELVGECPQPKGR